VKTSQLSKIKNLFAEYGYHFTKQRLFICRKLLESETCFMTGSEICQHLKDSDVKLSVSTIYRAIENLENIGFLNKAVLTNKVIKYKICFNCENYIHGHLICEECGKVIQLESKNIDKLLKEVKSEYNFKIRGQIIKEGYYGKIYF
jgi:Fe2+ or Zn2+ uptake regulation protein